MMSRPQEEGSEEGRDTLKPEGAEQVDETALLKQYVVTLVRRLEFFLLLALYSSFPGRPYSWRISLVFYTISCSFLRFDS